MDAHVISWIECLKKEHYGGDLQPNDYLFPHFSRSGHPQRDGPMSHDFAQDWLDFFATSANIAHANWKFTTHCFHRGGAQYRFMYSPKKWPLAVLHWWGGWAEGEQVSDLVIASSIQLNS